MSCALWVGGCDQPVECGDGTVKRDGACVVAGSDDGAGGTAADGTAANEPGGGDGKDDSNDDDDGRGGGGQADGQDDSQNDGDEDDGPGDGDQDEAGQDDVDDQADGGAGGPYGPCPGMSDVECNDYRGAGHVYAESCQPLLNGCAPTCDFDTDCGAPVGGTAVQRCEEIGNRDFACVLGCHAGLQCPEGMVCSDVPSWPSTVEVCTWP